MSQTDVRGTDLDALLETDTTVGVGDAAHDRDDMACSSFATWRGVSGNDSHSQRKVQPDSTL